jgi:hypothetical protein
MIAEIMSGRGPDDDEPWGQWAIIEMVSYGLGTIPLARDLAYPLESYIRGDRPRGTRPPPAGVMLDELRKAAIAMHKAVKHDDVDLIDITKPTVMVLGGMGYLPGAAQINVSSAYLDAIAKGTEDPGNIFELVHGILYGPEYQGKKKKKRSKKQLAGPRR